MRAGIITGLFLAVTAMAAEPLPEAVYGIGNWPEDGYGNHRAVIAVASEDAGAEAVKVAIPWRRLDTEPEKKALLLYDAAGNPIADIVPLAFAPECAEVAFRPAAGAGEYHLYFLPYHRAGMFDSEEYLPYRETAAPAWSRKVRSAAESLPSATLQSLQARNDFNRFDPMEVPATAAEAQALAGRFPGKKFLIFPEDRAHDIRMLDRIPLRWVKSGPSDRFAGTAQPGEYYVFQLGVWNPGAAPVTELAVASPEGATCFNTEGVDMLGKPFTRELTVAPGAVQPLWLGVAIPPDAEGEYRGEWELRSAGNAPERVAVTLKIAGPLLPDGGVDDLDRLSRLQWLNSTRGEEDTLLPGFDPVQYRDGIFQIRNRTVRFGANGLPESIVSNGRELLAAPLRLQSPEASLTGDALPELSRPIGVSSAEVHSRARLGDVAATVDTVAEADGCLQFFIRLTASRDVEWDNLTLEAPLAAEVAKYWMGMEKRGGLRRDNLDWQWHNKYLNNAIWVGDFDAGMQLKLQSEADPWALWSTLPDPAMPWNASGAGGCRSFADADTLTLQAYTGKIALKANESKLLRFRLLITPFKEFSPRHWQIRILDAFDNPDNTIFHLHHGSGYIPYINYPFTNMPGLTAFVDSLHAESEILADPGLVACDLAPVFNRATGALHIEAIVNFDSRDRVPGSNDSNQMLATLELGEKTGRLIFYWNTDDSGMRALWQQGAEDSPVYPAMIFGTPAEYRPGDRHTFSVGWGENLWVAIDGQILGQAPLGGLPASDRVELQLEGSGFTTAAVRLDDGAVWSRNFAGKSSLAESGLTATGVVELLPEGIRPGCRRIPRRALQTQLYYTVRELSNHCRELWAFRSLGDEIFTTGEGLTYTEMGAFTFGSNEGYPWLQEHLRTGYVPGWRSVNLGEDFCAAITTRSDSRLLNYYVEGIHWLFGKTGIQGLYLDGIGYGRDIMKRVARTMASLRPDYRINAHCSDLYEMDKISVMNHNMEHLPYVTDTWLGEAYQYSKSPDYYLIEISGIPFGVTNEMLNYENGGNPWRGMVYGMSGRFLPDVTAMWRFWDRFGIQDAEMLGYWNPACPVTTNLDAVKATCYRKSDEALIAVAHWPADTGAGVRRAEIPLLPSLETMARDGAELTGFYDYTDASVMPPELQTVVRAAALPEGLALEFDCRQPAPPRAQQRADDQPVWEDDAIEFFVQPDVAEKRYYQFIVNAAGSRFDSEGKDPAWNGVWESRVETASAGWRGRILIPWSTLGVAAPAEGAELGINIARDHGKRPSCWSYPDGSYHNVNAFSRWQVGREATRETAKPQDDALVSFTLRIAPDIFAGYDPVEYELYAPAIPSFQPERRFAPGETVTIRPAEGALLWLKRKDNR